jgi:hypothetical protein
MKFFSVKAIPFDDKVPCKMRVNLLEKILNNLKVKRDKNLNFNETVYNFLCSNFLS